MAVITTKQAMRQLKKALTEDEGYRLAWEANIKMAFIDAEYWHQERHKKKTGSNRRKALNKQDFNIIAEEAAQYFISTHLMK